MKRLAVIGASGFVGSAVAAAAEQRGHEVQRVAGPRLGAGSLSEDAAVEQLTVQLEGAQAVINCAGNPDASAADERDLMPVNAVLPGVIGTAARSAGVRRYVHVSSAVVQGRRPVLDSSRETDPFSVYARSKIEGEETALRLGPAETVVYRPPSVHAPSRRVTRQLAKIAGSSLSTVAGSGDRPTPQTHIDDVASAILLLATSPETPPSIVHHPWQGQTTGGLLQDLGEGRRPRRIPMPLARSVLRAGLLAGRLVPRVAPYARRLEMVWLGQAQAASWLTGQGWVPTTDPAAWTELGRSARGQADDER